MFSAKYYRVVFSFFMSLVMSCIMSLVICIFNMGLVSNLLSIWLNSWGFAFIIAFPTILIVSPGVNKLTEMVLDKD